VILPIRDVFAKVFNVPIGVAQACVFVEPGVIEQMAAMVEPAADCSRAAAIS
jgi:hypothetical protein